MRLTRRQFLRALALLPCLALPTPTLAQGPVRHKIFLPLLGDTSMADCTGSFPVTGVLDDFDRPDEGPPPSANWATLPGEHGLVVSDGACAPEPPFTAGTGYWRTLFGPNCEAFLTINSLGEGSADELMICIDPNFPDSTGYDVMIHRGNPGGDPVSRISLWDQSMGQVGEDYPITYSNGDSIGIRVCGRTVMAYYCPVGGAWVNIITGMTSAPPVAGVILLYSVIQGEVSNFGGGNCEGCPESSQAAELDAPDLACFSAPVLAFTDGEARVDLLGFDSGFSLGDPSWRPKFPQLKGGGSFSQSAVSDGAVITDAQYDNVVESVLLTVREESQHKAIITKRNLQQLLLQGRAYWTRPWEYRPVWLEVRPAGVNCQTGYSLIYTGDIVDLPEIFNQPFFSPFGKATLSDLTLVVQREPFWRGVPPGSRIGPLYNLLRNGDFELWNVGTADSQPDNWTDLEVGGITGANGRLNSFVQWGQYALQVQVTNSTAAGQVKGVNQLADGIEDGQEYTLVGWVRSDGVTGGLGRVLVTSAGGNYTAWSSADRMGWTLVTQVFTTTPGDIVGINLEIITTAAGASGTAYFDGFMLLKGDLHQEAIDNLLPCLSSSHLVNHCDADPGDINYLDVWNIPGDVDSLVRLEVQNNTTPADYTAPVELISKLRIGQRRTGDVQKFQNCHDPAGLADGTASNGDNIALTPTSDWTDVTTHAVIGEADVADNVGRFRVLARLWDAKASGNPTLEARLAYWSGVSHVGVKYLSGISLPQRGMWTLVDLTRYAAMVMSSKFMANYPGALSYTVQVRRVVGSGAGNLDYVLQMPTDGGYLDADVNPPLEKGVALVADSTAGASIGASGVKNGYIQKVTLDTAYGVPTFKEFLGNLYVGLRRSAPTQGGIWRQKGKTWSKVHTTVTPLTGVQPLEVYNGQLYGIEYNTTNFSLIRSPNGVIWSSVGTAAIAGPGYALKSFNGKLWVVVNNSIYSWDSSTLAFEVAIPDFINPQQVSAMEVFGGKLYVGSSATLNSQVYVYTPGSGWTVVQTFTDDEIKALKKFGGKLYLGTMSAAGGRIYAFDGSAWTEVFVAGGDVTALAVANGYLLATTGLALGNFQIYQSADGLTWTPIYSTTAISTMDGITLWNGEVTIAVTAVSGAAQVWTIVPDKAFEFSVSSYQGGAFTSPARRLTGDPVRHRWVFSCDRPDGSNVISDELLVGIGFVPRYLGLRGYD